MESTIKIVDFNEYCKKCKYKNLDEFMDPCNECLNNPVNINSKRPINYKDEQ